MQRGRVAVAVVGLASAVVVLAAVGPKIGPRTTLQTSTELGVPSTDAAGSVDALTRAKLAAGSPALDARERAAQRARPSLLGPDVGAEPDGSAAGDLLALVREAVREETPESSRTLVRALDGDDEVAKVTAIDELAKRSHRPALPKLLAFDPGADPFVAPTAILALGKLARGADVEEREAAVRRLARILDEEKARQGSDSPGNILTAFEALGEIRTPSAARVLEGELVAPQHGNAARVAIVEALLVCGQRSSAAALGAFRAAFEPTATDAFEREVERDLIAALERAIVALSHGS